jgi:hypothetical protein
MATSYIRKQAFAYIAENLTDLPVDSSADPVLCVPLEDLRLLREGLADPSAELVASLRILLGHAVGDNEFEMHLVTPFMLDHSVGE